jgi:Zn-dependent protease
MEFLFNVITFSLYVVLIFEFYIIFLLSTISEIKDFDRSTEFKKFSLVASFTFMFLLLAALLIALYQFVKAYKHYDETKQWYLRELFNGIKDSKSSRLFKPLFMVFRI